jgi:DNA-binding transcriptional MerR regulator
LELEKQYFTSGQISRHLRVSISTLKRWLRSDRILEKATRNVNGWRLFSYEDLEKLRKFKLEKKKNGKQFNSRILTPVR